MDRVTLVTGCSTGIGRETAIRFRKAGWTVFATARDPEDISDLRERGCRTLRLDVTEDASVERAVDRVFDDEGRLDCLVNNAGYGEFGPIEDVPIDRTIRQFDVNTFGPLRLVQAVLPRMRERGEGVVVNVAAGIGTATGPGIGVYTASKFALEALSDSLRQEVSQFGVDVVVVEPGFVATDFYDRTLDELAALDRTPAYDDLYRVLDSLGALETGGPGINPPERVAETIVTAASADSPDPVYRVGPVAVVGTGLGAVIRGRLRDRLARRGIDVLSSDPVQRRLRE